MSNEDYIGKSTAIYCPLCGRELEPENEAEFESGEHASLIYVHDDVPHADEDFEALANGIN